MGQVDVELKTDELQVQIIRPIVPVAGAPADILVETVFLKYDTARAATDPEHLVSLRDLNARLAGSVAVISFSIGDATPITITNWDTVYAALYGTGKFWVQFLNADGSISDRFDIPVTRIIDRTNPLNEFQHSVVLDFGGIPLSLDGQIIIEPSNVPVL